MTNRRITVDEHLLKKARLKALKEGTTVDALLTSFLERYIRDVKTGRRKAIQHILVLSRSSRASRSGRRWTRDELHERCA
jgi:hypothetical protein